MHKCDTEGFVPVASLNGVVGSPSLFIRSLIGRTGKYDLSYTLMKNKYTLPKPLHIPQDSVQFYATFSLSLGLVCSFPDVPEPQTSS